MKKILLSSFVVLVLTGCGAESGPEATLTIASSENSVQLVEKALSAGNGATSQGTTASGYSISSRSDGTTDCDNVGSGTATVTSTSSSVTVVLNNCLDGTETTDGSITISFSYTTSSVTLRMEGDLLVSEGSESVDLQDFSSQLTISESGISHEYSYFMDAHTTSFTGVIFVETISPVIRESLLETYPSSGQVKISGAENTSIILTVVDDPVVGLEININNELTYYRAWADLDI